MQLKSKSEINLEASELLLQEGYYCTYIHALYYSWYQISKHKLFHNHEVNYETQDDNYTHGELVNELSELSKNYKYRKYMFALMKLRHTADYCNQEINERQANEGKNYHTLLTESWKQLKI